ncbi:MAG: hypothetical protein ABF713_11210 [Acetobacter orientalis]
MTLQPLVWPFSMRACLMIFVTRSIHVSQESRASQNTATERWLQTIREKAEGTPTPPRVHFQRAPLRPVDKEGPLRDFE